MRSGMAAAVLGLLGSASAWGQVLDSGSTYDWQSGNSYNWSTDDLGTTRIQGLNPRSGSQWSQTIKPNGDEEGRDSRGNPWSYDRSTDSYINYGTGEMRFGGIEIPGND